MRIPTNLRESLILFEKLINQLPDRAQSVPEFSKFLRYFFRSRHPKFPLPSVEIISIIKNEKPTVFYFLRKQSLRDPMLQLVIDVEMDVEKARERIDFLRSQL